MRRRSSNAVRRTRLWSVERRMSYWNYCSLIDVSKQQQHSRQHVEALLSMMVAYPQPVLSRREVLAMGRAVETARRWSHRMAQ